MAYWLQYTLMIAIVGVLVLKFRVDPAGLLIGLSMLVASIVIEALRKIATR